MSLQRYVRQLKPIQENKTDYVNVVQDLLEAKIKAEDYEAAIVIGWHENNGIKYLECILQTLRTIDDQWNSLKKMKVMDILTKNIKYISHMPNKTDVNGYVK